MTKLTRRSLLRGVTVLTAATALPGSGFITSFRAWAQTVPGKLEDSVRALFFDVFGTMVDWRTGVAREAQAILKPLGYALNWLAFADAWRAQYQPAMDEVRAGRIPFAKLDVLNRRILDQLRPRFGLEKVDEKVLQELTLAWHRLDAWKDVPPGLSRLPRRFLIAPVSNANISLMVDVARRNDFRWDAILGAEIAGDFKPKPRVYLSAAEGFGLKPGDCMMVAAHSGDLKAAAASGLRTAHVARPDEDGPGTGESGPKVPVDIAPLDRSKTSQTSLLPERDCARVIGGALEQRISPTSRNGASPM
jgi:2-haloacid dehalogenase